MIYVNIMGIFAYLRGRNLTVTGEFHFYIYIYIYPLNSLNLVIISGKKSDGQRDGWTGCRNEFSFLPRLRKHSLSN